MQRREVTKKKKKELALLAKTILGGAEINLILYKKNKKNKKNKKQKKQKQKQKQKQTNYPHTTS